MSSATGERFVSYAEFAQLSFPEWMHFHDELERVERERPDLYLLRTEVPGGILYRWGPR